MDYGWIKATISEKNTEVYYMGSKIRVEIMSDGSDGGNSSSNTPHLDSTVMNLPIGEAKK